MAMFGEMMRNKGYFNGKQILAKEVVESVRSGGSQTAFAKAGYTNLKQWSYKNMWWVSHNADGAFCARGVHGQTIYIDPKAEMVIVRFASHPIASNSANDGYSLPAYQAVADYLTLPHRQAKQK
jgi:CubicO group peptidase (beta-lactamase class C family)